MKRLPTAYEACVGETRSELANVDGWLSDREMRFLITLGANPTCSGAILELGSYRGKSTIALAKGAKLGDGATVHTVDPLPPAQLLRNLDRANVANQVTNYHELSSDRTPLWNTPLRLLWHDGANDLATVTDDVERLVPWLEDRAIIAFHDVLNTSGARILAFTELVLGNPNFGVAGVCGSIGWAQYRERSVDAEPHHLTKARLRRKLTRLHPFHDAEQRLVAARLRYKLLRSMVPHRAIAPEAWIRQVA
ncbi:class I SAM-dependent methyltransferase [Pirellulales bacterium]|nr:class I SAM-dependent methyltransferase [Pirellulales bacterium]